MEPFMADGISELQAPQHMAFKGRSELGSSIFMVMPCSRLQ